MFCKDAIQLGLRQKKHIFLCSDIRFCLPLQANNHSETLSVMKKMLMLLLLFAGTLTGFAQAAADDEYAAEVKKYIAASKVEETVAQQMDAQFTALKAQAPITDAQIEEMKKVAIESYREFVLPKYVEVCRKHLTLDDLKAVNAFYASPAGKKLSESIIPISTDLMPTLTEWQPKLQEALMKIMQGI